jgi:predicted branched-subunit amino acid permease
MTSREWLTAVVLGLIVSAILLVYFPAAMVVSIASGVFAAFRELRSLWPVTVGLVAGLGAVVSDLVASHELIGFHLAVTFTMCALAWSAWSITGRLIRADHRG